MPSRLFHSLKLTRRERIAIGVLTAFVLAIAIAAAIGRKSADSPVVVVAPPPPDSSAVQQVTAPAKQKSSKRRKSAHRANSSRPAPRRSPLDEPVTITSDEVAATGEDNFAR